jgi:SAM-dependent methyltransferase
VHIRWRGQDSNLRSRFRRQIYSLLVLTTHPPLHEGSRRRESNPQPSVYKTLALPLSYAGDHTHFEDYTVCPEPGQTGGQGVPRRRHRSAFGISLISARICIGNRPVGVTVEPSGDQKWITLGHPSYIWRFGQDRRLALIRRHACFDTRWVLDVGCGIGTYVRKFRQYSTHAFGIDVDIDRVSEGARSIPNLQVAQAEHLPFADGSFDVVVLNEVIEHVTDDARTIAESVRLLRPGGRVVIYAPNRLYPFETHGIYLGKRYVFRLIPFVNWLPDSLRRKFAPHVRAYTTSGIRRLFDGVPARIVHHDYVYPGFDNIVARRSRLGLFLRRVFYFFEHTPLKYFGLSHFLVAERIQEQSNHVIGDR